MKKSMMFGLVVFAVFVFGFVVSFHLVKADNSILDSPVCSSQGGQLCNSLEICNGTLVDSSDASYNEPCCIQGPCVSVASSNLVLTKLEKTQNNSAIYFCVKNTGNESSPNFYLSVKINNSSHTMGFGFNKRPSYWSNPLAPNQEECKIQYLNVSDEGSTVFAIDSALLDSFKSKNDSVTLFFRIKGVQLVPHGYNTFPLTSYDHNLTYSWSEIYNELSNSNLRATNYYNTLQRKEVNQNLSKFLILENISLWSFENGSGLITDIPATPEGLSRSYTIYESTYTSGVEDAKVEVAQFFSGVVNEDFLKDFIRLAVENRFVNIQSKTFDNKTYLYAESTEKETMVGSETTKTYTISNYYWYNGDKIVAISSRKDYSNETKEILTTYMNKYPSELTAPQGFVEWIVNFFRNLFGIK